jgi:ankyrin repeat protein
MGNGCTSTRSSRIVSAEVLNGDAMNPVKTYHYCKQHVMSGVVERQLLVHAIINQDVDRVRGSLTRGDVDLSTQGELRSDLMPPLVYATVLGNRDICQLLIDAGSDACAFVSNVKACTIGRPTCSSSSVSSSKHDIPQSAQTSHSYLSQATPHTEPEHMFIDPQSESGAEIMQSNTKPNVPSHIFDGNQNLLKAEPELQTTMTQPYVEGASPLTYPDLALEEVEYVSPSVTIHNEAFFHPITKCDSASLSNDWLEADEWQPMHVAAFYDHVSLLDMFMTVCGVAVNVKSRFNNHTPLQIAAQAGSLASVQYLSSCGANVDHRDIHGETALYKAVRAGHKNVVDNLIKAGADFTAMPHFLETLLKTIAIPSKPSDETKDRNKMAALNELLKHLNVNDAKNLTAKLYYDARNEVQWHLAHFALSCGHTGLLKCVVDNSEAGPNVASSDGTTLLHLAVTITHDVKMFHFLASLKPDVLKTDKLGRSILCVAAINGRHDVINWIKNTTGGALFKTGKNPLWESMFNSALGDLKKCHVIHQLSRLYGRRTVVEASEAEGNILHKAVLTQAPIVITELVRAGFHVNSLDQSGNSVLHVLTTTCPNEYSQMDICLTVIDLGVDLSIINDRGHSALSLALALKLRILVQLFHAAGAPIDAPSKHEINKIVRFTNLLEKQKSAAKFLAGNLFANLLVRWYRNPQNLRYLCRRKIRSLLHDDLFKVQVLCLTKSLVRYIMLRDIQAMYTGLDNG